MPKNRRMLDRQAFTDSGNLLNIAGTLLLAERVTVICVHSAGVKTAAKTRMWS
jgi:hypothetical protein